ncbi:MAG: 2-oxoglutarate dehydrogenase E1 component [Lentimicrobiaceae bacterium]|jgi:2-oxoglutarate dehydrogenase E1 component|nr:2-oxoglutarate dehydrogenase E1 component [Lentimicrobiaceae bacterium]MBT3453575.1 2-oxoglutarate dehydrogenase E1 component [Lentimicrobiaceae bacterium]MBT3818916.1 2-oxoglutarate dehydrogenase E1 component [Lentimicrobiaceae bacterium]MBT4060439.1 2-oxoglutarate dehydrogenase E1 component [Lentimicrobiaceae bacterium]MBT4190605.1 2-oxoglutarate dehydrogenase E1 component [Lentimicrobiaceae bacterium]
MDRYNFLNNSDPSTIEELYKKYKENPSELDEGWASFFEGMDFALQNYSANSSELSSSDEFKVINLINDYRRRGHLFTKTNPVRKRREYKPSLSLDYFDLTEKDLDREFDAGHKLGIGRAKLKDIISFLEQTYCRSIGVEFLFIRDLEMVTWLQHHFESHRNSPEYSNDEKLYILEKLRRSVFFEFFLQKKFPGQKRFSLEGAEALIPALDAIMEKGSETGIKEFIIGMPHRGRLNVLVNILRKPYKDVFSEFEGVEYDNESLLGDVKYHLGYTINRKSSNGKEIKFTLAPNPSHLEAVDPVVEGITRAKIDEIYEGDASNIAPILIHGDSSIAGQGVVYEVLQMQDLAGYSTGGTIHLVINNQIGFTTDYLDARSSTYCTDVAKTTLSPVFHVNGDDPESLVYSIQTAMEFRNKFKKDVFIDILCYRRYGHNEGDEPRFTQPTLYKAIEKHPNPYIIYKDQLIKEGITDAETCEKEETQFLEKLEENYVKGKTTKKTTIDSFLSETWKDIRKAEENDFLKSPDTSIKKTTLKRLVKKLNELPDNKKFFRKSVRLHNQRLKMLEDGGKFDWAMGELLAYGSLVEAGIPIRISGQDVERGTFSHRHAVLSLENSEEKYIPLQHLTEDQASFEIYNSSLSEYGVLGFEYGYSLASPNKLTIWEAQFGDFANAAQVIFDQFISSAEDKWNVMNDLVVLLPHGYEGQGPEHSSARMERFLLLCADNNMQVANCTTPANFFHILRRQLYRPFRKPLIVFTPKSLLRHPKCISPSSAFTSGGFKEIIDDNTTKPELVEKIAMCTGKIYYELLQENEKIADGRVAIVRIEQLYPFPMIQLKEILSRYKNATSYNWVQEEPSNMGAWEYVFNKLTDEIKISVVARPASGSPSTGSHKFHNIRQQKIIDKVFGLCDCPYINDECKMGCIGNKWKSFEKELEEMNIDKMESTFHSGSKPLK